MSQIENNETKNKSSSKENSSLSEGDASQAEVIRIYGFTADPEPKKAKKGSKNGSRARSANVSSWIWWE
jgi:hypothetical protein